MTEGVPLDFWGRVQKMIDDAVAKLARSGMLRNASISEGGALTIKGGKLVVLHPASSGGGVGAYFGPVYNENDLSYVGTGILVQDADGTDIATFRSDAASGNPICVLWDKQQNAVVFTDASGVGLGRPYIPFHFYGARFTADHQVSTSTSFETLWMASTYKINPGVYVAAAAVADAGVTAEVRLLVNGTQLGSVASIGSTASAFAFGPGAVAGAVGDQLTVQLQARITSGAGAVRVAPQIGTGFPT